MTDTNKTDLTPERLDKLSNLASLATPGPWRPIQLERPTTRLALVEQIVANWLHPEGSPLCDPDFFGVVAGEGDRSVSTCMTANGPTSRVNACFIAAANPETVLALVDEVERLRRRCDMRDRSAAQWAEAAKREAPTPEALERARERFVECKIRQEEAPPGSIMRRVCDAAMELADLLEQRNTTMEARVVALSLEVDRLLSERSPDPLDAESGYQPLDHAMQILRRCLHPYTGEQAQAVAKVLRQWHDKWAAVVDLLPVRDAKAEKALREVAIRDAFDAGARAMREEMVRRIGATETYVSTNVRVDITKLPGRPEVQP